MKYYAHFGHRDFILCLGYRGDMIKDFFVNYKEWVSNDFMLADGGQSIELLNRDIDDWRITFVDTGLHANIGERLVAVREHLKNEDYFLANYSDGLTDLNLTTYIDRCREQDVIGSFLAVRTWHSFHAVKAQDDGFVTSIGKLNDTEFWVNGGFFLFKGAIFDYIDQGEELVEAPFDRLISARELFAYRYEGFWRAMDTFKDKIEVDRAYARGHAPWQVWGR
jgi:glucose-1-phosphate cytidylyltransferase